MKVKVIEAFRDKFHLSRVFFTGEVVNFEDERAKTLLESGLVEKVDKKADAEETDPTDFDENPNEGTEDKKVETDAEGTQDTDPKAEEKAAEDAKAESIRKAKAQLAKAKKKN